MRKNQNNRWEWQKHYFIIILFINRIWRQPKLWDARQQFCQSQHSNVGSKRFGWGFLHQKWGYTGSFWLLEGNVLKSTKRFQNHAVPRSTTSWRCVFCCTSTCKCRSGSHWTLNQSLRQRFCVKQPTEVHRFDREPRSCKSPDILVVFRQQRFKSHPPEVADQRKLQPQQHGI